MPRDRIFGAAPFVVLGGSSVVAGGLVAAASALAPSTHASWAAAYLVLVAGVAQIALGLGQAALAPQAPAGKLVAAQAGLWNTGNAAVLVGTLAGVASLVDLGGAFLVTCLVLLAHAVRGGVSRGGWRWGQYGFWLLVFVLLLSIPIGLVLARLMPA